jgi:hypothetical protein
MKSSQVCFLSLALWLAFPPALSLGQLTVDATGPVRRRTREPTIGRGGSFARKLPLLVTITALGGWDNDDKIKVEFTLTNAGKDVLTLPMSPNPGDLEPPKQTASYSVKRLSLFVTSDKRRVKILPGQTHLYGSVAFPGTLLELASGKSVRVLALVAIPRPSVTESAPPTLVAHAALDDETIRTIDRQILSDAQEIGSASSLEYTPQSLLKSPE